MPKDRPPRLRLFDILNEVARIQGWLVGARREQFLDDDQLQYAVERSLQIISEASRHLTPEMKAAHPDVNWRGVVDFGNLSRHGYDEVEVARVWKVATSELSNLYVACTQLYREVKKPADPWPDAGKTPRDA